MLRSIERLEDGYPVRLLDFEAPTNGGMSQAQDAPNGHQRSHRIFDSFRLNHPSTVPEVRLKQISRKCRIRHPANEKCFQPQVFAHLLQGLPCFVDLVFYEGNNSGSMFSVGFHHHFG